MPEFHINFTCGCVLDRHGDDVWCPDHRHVPVMREGASLRTAHELQQVFVEDAWHLTHGSVPDMKAEWAVVLEQVEEDYAASGTGWVENEDLVYELSAICDEADTMLGNAGWTVDWDDGYLIWRPTGDNPVAEYRHRNEVNDPERSR